MNTDSRFDDVIARVLDEIARQDAKWGADRLLRPSARGLFNLGRHLEEHARLLLREEDCDPTWPSILLEELGEACQEPAGHPRRVEELVQTAAVLFQWLRQEIARPSGPLMRDEAVERLRAKAASLGLGARVEVDYRQGVFRVHLLDAGTLLHLDEEEQVEGLLRALAGGGE